MVSKFALAGALLAGSVAASPVTARANDIIKRTPSPMTFNCAKEWVDETLFAGTCPSLIGLDVDVDAAVDVNLGLSLPKGAINGEISIGLCDGFLLNPTLSIDLSGFEAYVELDISASAAVYESIELVASGHLALEVPDLLDAGIDAGLAIDLIVGVSAAIDLEAGFYLSFPENSVIEISLLTQEIVGGSLGGVIANALPIGLGVDVDLSAEIELQLGLRLRTLVAAKAGLDVLGLNLGAGLEAAVYVSLFDYTQVLVATAECPLSVAESFCIEVGIAVDLDVEVGDVLDINLAPTVHVGIAAAPTANVCLPTLPSCSRCAGNGGDSMPSLTNALPGIPSVTSSAAPGITGAPTSSGAIPGSDLVPTTIYETSTYVVTQCALTVPNCPAGHTQKVITSTVKTTVTYCPASETGGALPVATTSSIPTSVQVPVPTETKSVTLTECPATTKTYTPPADAPTPPPTVIVPDTPKPTVPAEGSVTSVPVIPAHGASSTLPVVHTESVPAVPHAPSDCVGCVGPVTGVPSKPHTTGVPPVGTNPSSPEQPVASSSLIPSPSNTYVPVPAGGVRVATGAAGAIVAVGAVLAML